MSGSGHFDYCCMMLVAIGMSLYFLRTEMNEIHLSNWQLNELHST